jgi:membrane-bound ClpP family serine protease
VSRWVLAFVSVLALSACASDGGGIDVIDVSGPLDESALDFISDTIEQGADLGQEMAVVQLNSKAVLDREAFDRLSALIEKPPLPVAVWVGPSPAFAFGAAAELPDIASHSAIAPPDSMTGHYTPAVLGEDVGSTNEEILAEDTGLLLQPTIRQYLQDLDGATFVTSKGDVTVSTSRL